MSTGVSIEVCEVKHDGCCVRHERLRNVEVTQENHGTRIGSMEGRMEDMEGSVQWMRDNIVKAVAITGLLSALGAGFLSVVLTLTAIYFSK